MRRKTDVTFAANSEIYYQDFSSLKQNNKKGKGIVIPFLIQMWNQISNLVVIWCMQPLKSIKVKMVIIILK